MSIITSVVLVLQLTTRTESSEMTWSHFSHQLPGRASMMSVTRSYPGHSVQDNDTYKETLNHRDAIDDGAVYPGDPLGERRPGPFAPRFRVPRWEISDEEWSEEIAEGFANTGIIPGILAKPPPGLININYDIHSCIHMGNVLSASVTMKPPKVSWPTERGRLYSLMMLETDSMSLHWLKVNIVRSDMMTGDTVVPYHPPAHQGQFLMVALLQTGELPPDILPHTDCLHRVDLRRMITHLHSELVVAANYWRQQPARDRLGSYAVCGE